MKKYLDEALYEYSQDTCYPFHMPGHKRNYCPETLRNPYQIDITEIDGFDNLHHAEGILREAQKRAAALYGAEESFYLVNGSTSGLLSAVSACTSRNGSLLMARNCHKAVYHAVYLRGIQVHYLYPPCEKQIGLNGGIAPEQVRKMLEQYPEIEAVLITSPSYDGIVSDIQAISHVTHEWGVPLIVDEAHGAHLCFSDYFPDSALKYGADLVIQSLHKTLPAMTQTALLHVQGSLVSREILRRFLGIYQSSSPSYVFMSSMEACIRLMEREGTERFHSYTKRLEVCRERLNSMNHLHLIVPGQVAGKGNIYDVDRSKLIISTAGTSIDGEMLHMELLHSYGIQIEMTAPSYVLALSSVMDTEEGFSRLEQALLEIDGKLCKEKAYRREIEFVQETYAGKQTPAVKLADAMESSWKEMKLEESMGQISVEFVYLYPPGIPCLVPGEIITGDFLKKIHIWKKQGLDIQGPADYTLEKIRVQKR
ncbi:MAG: aminotransferase class I/II-fold pyridoxal phosphate-dependent enzyme [Blautia sp.]